MHSEQTPSKAFPVGKMLVAPCPALCLVVLDEERKCIFTRQTPQFLPALSTPPGALGKEICEELLWSDPWTVVLCVLLLSACPMQSLSLPMPRCDSGGDCECLCTAIATYAEECSQRGVSVRWRSQELCRKSCNLQWGVCVCGVLSRKEEDPSTARAHGTKDVSQPRSLLLTANKKGGS